MVAEALVALPAWQALIPPARAVLFTAALLHDVAKPICTEIDGAGRIRSPHHARKGEQLARTLLWRDAAQYGGIPFPYREQIAKLVRHHGLPLWLLDKADPARTVVAASQIVCLDDVALLAEADVRGRSCADQRELLDRIELFRQYCAELDCLVQPRAFASAHSRFRYFRQADTALHYDAYDDTRFEVTLLCGLPAAGKDTWVRQHASHLPIIALDAIRAELDVAPGKHSGQVVLQAKRHARQLLQHQQPFVWNATNITRRLRRQLIDFFAGYGARVRIVYVDAPLDVLLQRNRARPDPVPERDRALQVRLRRLSPDRARLWQPLDGSAIAAQSAARRRVAVVISAFGLTLDHERARGKHMGQRIHLRLVSRIAQGSAHLAQQRHGDRIATNQRVPRCGSAQIEPADLANSGVLRGINLGLDPGSRLAASHVAEVGAQPIVDAARMIGRLEQRSHDHNLQLGLFAHLAPDARLLGFALFAPAARQQPERGPAINVDGLQQQHVILTNNRGLVAHIASQHRSLLSYRASPGQV
jgi:predicted kinase